MYSIAIGNTTQYERQIGVEVSITNDNEKSALISIFCDCIEPDNTRIMAMLHGSENILCVGVDASNFRTPTFPHSYSIDTKIITFDNVEVHVKLTDEGIVLDVIDSIQCEDGCIDSTYLYFNELFQLEE